MTASEAFEILGLCADADARAIKRAYHKLLKRHKPDSDPEGFRRLRDAFEVASEAEAMLAFQAQFDAPVSSSEDEDPGGPDQPQDSEDSDEAPQSEVDPDVVHGALDRDEVPWAYELVMDDRWAAAMLGEHGGALRWATRRVGLRLVLLYRPAFDLLVSKYPDAFETNDAQLVYLLRVSEEWSPLVAELPLPSVLLAFATRVPLEEDAAVCRDLARALGKWFQCDVDRGMLLLDTIAMRSSDVGPFLCELTAEFDDELDAQAAGDPPAKSLRVLTRTTIALSIVLPIVVFFLAGLVDNPVWGFQQFGFCVGAVLGFIYAEGAVYEALPSLRRRFLLACIDAGIEPSLAAVGLRGHIYLREAIQKDPGLDLAFRVGRLAQLGRGT